MRPLHRLCAFPKAHRARSTASHQPILRNVLTPYHKSRGRKTPSVLGGQDCQYELRLSRDARAKTKTEGPGVGTLPHPGFWRGIRCAHQHVPFSWLVRPVHLREAGQPVSKKKTAAGVMSRRRFFQQSDSTPRSGGGLGALDPDGTARLLLAAAFDSVLGENRTGEEQCKSCKSTFFEHHFSFLKRSCQFDYHSGLHRRPLTSSAFWYPVYL